MGSSVSVLIGAAFLAVAALVDTSALGAEGNFSITNGNCTFSFNFSKTPTARGPELTAERVLSPTCDLDFPEETRDVDLLLAHAEHDHVNLRLLRGLAWRAMHEKTLVERAAEANIAKFGGRNFGEREFTDLLKNSDVFSELVNVFKKYGLKLTVADVEEAEAYSMKELQSKGVNLPISKLPPKRKVTAGAELLWFNVENE